MLPDIRKELAERQEDGKADWACIAIKAALAEWEFKWLLCGEEIDSELVAIDHLGPLEPPLKLHDAVGDKLWESISLPIPVLKSKVIVKKLNQLN